jgi:L-amino acid N-acyltransferase YncA
MALARNPQTGLIEDVGGTAYAPEEPQAADLAQGGIQWVQAAGRAANLFAPGVSSAGTAPTSPSTATVEAPPQPAPLPEPMPTSAQAPAAPPQPVLPPIGPDVSRARSKGTEQAQATDEEKAAAGELRAAQEAGKGQIRAAGDLASQKAGVTADAAALEAQAERDRAAEAELRAKEYERKESEATAYLDRERQKLAGMKITDLFEGREASGILAALSIGLGQYASAMGAGPNTALSIINAARERHFRKETAEIDRQEKAVSGARQGVQDTLQRRQIAEVEAANLWEAKLRAIRAQRESNLAKFGADEERIRTDALINATDREIAQTELQRQQGLRRIVREGEQTTVSNHSQQAARLAAAKQVGQGDELIVTGPGGQPIFRARNEKEHKEASDKVAAVRNLVAKTAELEALLKEGPAIGERGDRAAALQKQITLAIKNSENLGALDHGSVEFTEDMVPKDRGWRGQGLNKLAQFKKGIIENAQMKFDAYGVDGAQVMQIIGAAGGPPKMSSAEIAKLQQAARQHPPGTPEHDRIMAALRAGR